MKQIAVLERSLGDALGLALPLLARAEAERVPWMAASVVRGPAVVLGAAQRAGRVLLLDACAAGGVAVLRRATSGTAAYVGGRGIVWTLALPHVAALVPDATPRTLLNRNVRGFLAGFQRAGAIGRYFGRESISVKGRPAAVLGFEVSPGGAVLLEVIAGVDEPVAVPDAIAAAPERAVDRWLGKAPAALSALLTGAPDAIAREVMRGVALHARAAVEEVGPVERAPIDAVASEDDPMPEGFVPGPPVRVPIGWIDTGAEPASGRVWLGGDVLAAAHVLRAVAAGDDVLPAEISLEGATLSDLREAVRRATG